MSSTLKLDQVIERTTDLANKAKFLAEDAKELQQVAQDAVTHVAAGQESAVLGVSPFMIGLTVFVLAIFVGYHVVWRVTPALHSPLMALTNAISSVIIVGALMAAGLPNLGFAKIMGFIAVTLAAVNIFGGFIVTQRMLSMFSGKQKKKG